MKKTAMLSGVFLALCRFRYDGAHHSAYRAELPGVRAAGDFAKPSALLPPWRGA